MGTVQRGQPKGVIIDLGKIEANCRSGNSQGESYHAGERIKVLILKVAKTPRDAGNSVKDPSQPGQALFELEVRKYMKNSGDQECGQEPASGPRSRWPAITIKSTRSALRGR